MRGDEAVEEEHGNGEHRVAENAALVPVVEHISGVLEYFEEVLAHYFVDSEKSVDEVFMASCCFFQLCYLSRNVLSFGKRRQSGLLLGGVMDVRRAG